MGNYILLVTLATVVAVSSLMSSTRSSNIRADVRLASHTYKSVIAREAATTGLNLTVRRLVADTSRWTHDPSEYGFTDQPYKKARFTTAVLANYSPGPLLNQCAVDTVDVVSTGFPDGSRGANHRIEATYVRSCDQKLITRSWGSFTLGYDGSAGVGGGGGTRTDTLIVPSGVQLVSYAEW
ncbi:MAG TPA: hypothetical protein VMO47_05605 [Rhodothermales bacterium]|nr:hypothetical protein [Rhodothermales bacterium]